MIAVTESSVVTVIVAVIGAIASVVSAVLVQRTHREVRSSNGTRTGALVDSIADKVFAIDTAVDALTVRMAELSLDLERHAHDHAVHKTRRRNRP